MTPKRQIKKHFRSGYKLSAAAKEAIIEEARKAAAAGDADYSVNKVAKRHGVATSTVSRLLARNSVVPPSSRRFGAVATEERPSVFGKRAPGAERPVTPDAIAGFMQLPLAERKGAIALDMQQWLAAAEVWRVILHDLPQKDRKALDKVIDGLREFAQ